MFTQFIIVLKVRLKVYIPKEKAIENIEKDEEKIINECIVIYKIPFNQECIFDLGYEYSVVYPQKEQKNKIELKN